MKLEQAARQALEALVVAEEFVDRHSEDWYISGQQDLKQIRESITALREALDHSGEANKMVGCAYCNNPLFAGTKCNNCGRVTLAEQERKAKYDERFERLEKFEQKAEQEPVGVVEGSGEWGIAGVLVAGVPIGTKLYAAPVRTKDLTDDELREIMKQPFNQREYLEQFARAVIAADREKNK